MSTSPNPVTAGLSMLWARRVSRPRPSGAAPAANAPPGHTGLAPILRVLAAGGVQALGDVKHELRTYLGGLEAVHPDRLTRDEALAFWLNLYNAAALLLASDAHRLGEGSVLGVPGGFRRPIARVAGESLSLDDIEHGKVRRFHDPRVHSALVCGSVSCPTLRHEPFEGARIDPQLDDQMRSFLGSGAVRIDRDAGVLELSRIFLWFGGDFTRPRSMPTVLPARRSRLVEALVKWLDPADARWLRANSPQVTFLPYDWGLSCAVDTRSGTPGSGDQ